MSYESFSMSHLVSSETMRSQLELQLKRSVGLVLHHAICVCNDGPRGEFSGVKWVNGKSASVKICLRIGLGKDDTRSTFLPSAPWQRMFFLTPLPSHIHLTLPDEVNGNQ